MAQQFGTAATFGLTFETGVITDGLTYNYSNENKVLRNGSGDITGKTYYNEQIEISISGFIPTGTPFAGTIGALITLVTAPTDYLAGSVGTKTIVETVNKTLSSEEYERIEVGAMHHPLIS